MLLNRGKVENIRKDWFRAHFVVCPRDGSQLRIREFEYDETVIPDLDVSCPLCVGEAKLLLMAYKDA